MTDLHINIGGTLLDVDDETRIGLSYQSRWLMGDGGAKTRSYDMTVPATVKNDAIFDRYGEPSCGGVRQRIAATIGSSGVVADGWLYVTGCDGTRYSVLFLTGNIFSGFNDVPTWIFHDTVTIRDKMEPVAGGRIPNFGFYQYLNGVNNGVVGPPVSMYPSANLGYLIDTIAAAAGWTVNYPDQSLGRRYQADAYGIVLPTMRIYDDNTVEIDGSGVGGWNVTVQGGGSLSDCALTVQTRRYKRGNLWENKTVHTFTAIRPVKVIVPDGQGVVIAGGEGYEIKNSWNGQHGCELVMQTGDWFTVVSPQDWHYTSGGNIWNGTLLSPRGYETSVQAVFYTHEDSGTAESGAVVDLGLNLPSLSLKEYLDAYCHIICAYWLADESTKIVTIVPFDSLLDNLEHFIDLDSSKILKVKASRRYIDGWAQHNLVMFDSAEYVPDHCRFRRDYPVGNDYPEQERVVAVVPFNDGEWVFDQNGRKRAFFDDIMQGANGEMTYHGVISLFYENANGNDGALHVQTVNDEGLGEKYGNFTREAMTLEVEVVMPLYVFMELKETSAATFRGRAFVVESATWEGGVCSLVLLSVNI